MKLPNGFGSVHKLSGKRRKPFIAQKTAGWEIDEKTGKAKQKYKIIGYYETRQAALIALSDFNAHPYNVDAAKVTFAEMFDKFMNQPHIEKLSRSSKTGYQAAFKHCGSIHDMKFIDLRKSHLQDCIDDIDNAGWATRKKVKVLYSQLYSLARELDICEKDYSEFVDVGTNEAPSQRVPFTQSEIDIVWEHEHDIEFLDTVLILLYTGMRVSEMLDIYIKDVNLENWTMRGGNKTFAGINRLIPIHSKIRHIVKKYYNPENEYLVTYPDGRHISYGNYRDTYWDPSMIALGLHHLPHECRHTFISRMDSAGANNTVIKRIVGHAGKGITEKVYTHKDIDELKAGIEMIT